MPASEPEKIHEKQIVEKLTAIDKIPKIEKIEHKEKPEKFEVKEKPEKHEHKEKPEKFEFKEWDKIIVERIDPGDPGDPEAGASLSQRVAALEQTVASLNHFITTGQRPDLSKGALTNEPSAKK